LHNVRCLVTGATGFIGQHLVNRLRSEGAIVRGVAGSGARSRSDHLERVDLADLPQDSSIADDVDVVFHLAAKTHDGPDGANSDADYFRVNVEGTARLLSLCAARSVKRVIFASSLKAVGETSPVPIDETTEPRPVTSYGRSKLEAEKIVLTPGKWTFEAVVLRFPLVYGPGHYGNLDRLIRAIARNRLPPLPRVANRRSMLHVNNAVDAFLLAACHPGAPGQVYCVGDARAYSTRELYDAIRSALRRPATSLAAPLWMFRLLAVGGDFAHSVLRRRMPFDSEAFRKMFGPAVCRIDRIQRELGYVPACDLLTEIPEIVASRASHA
jgi:nucleoside-diphosphate-sugar epimerase